MIQYTDVPITFAVEGVDMTSVTQPHVTFKQGETVVDVTELNVIDSSNFSIVLTQSETGRFKVGGISVQINFIDGAGHRRASELATISASSNLLRRILSNG